MKFNYTKTFLIITACGAACLLAVELILGLDPGRTGGSLGKLIVGSLIGSPLMAVADLVSWLRERGRRGRASRSIPLR